MLSIKKCDFCATTHLTHTYTPINSARGMEVYVCDTCGLVQSFSTTVYKSRPPGSMSADADRSSYRYTKDVISDRYEEYFNNFIDFTKCEHILDIGSNRGAFIKWLEKRHPGKKIVAIEPDSTVTKEYSSLPNVSLQECRFENTKLPENYFNFAYCAHTLEHASSAYNMLQETHKYLRVGGIFFLVVPNLIFHTDIIEEIFIDPHTYHFNFHLLQNIVTQIGFSVECSGDPKDAEIVLLLKKNHLETSSLKQDSFDQALPRINRDNIDCYKYNLLQNRAALRESAVRLNSVADNYKVVIWGGGRILDALVRFGHLDLAKIHLLVDKFLFRYVERIHGCKLVSPDALRAENPINIIVYIASRDFADEIRAEASALGIINFIQFGNNS